MNNGYGQWNGAPYDPIGLAWGLFKESGDPRFYLLYKDLQTVEEKKRERR